MAVEELKCPWCGTNFQNAKELDIHARKHYCKESIASFSFSVKKSKTESETQPKLNFSQV
jgi:uncharacterized C2H2 Zn-finger protein